jgi:beta-lactam-binding protein with PASTA domain
MSFDEAEAILRAAGFSVEARPDVNAPQNPNRSIDWYAVLAKIPHFVVLFFH